MRDELIQWGKFSPGRHCVSGNPFCGEPPHILEWSIHCPRTPAEGKALGLPRSGLGTIIAATAGANDCVVVTDNEKDFAGIQFINPMRAAS